MRSPTCVSLVLLGLAAGSLTAADAAGGGAKAVKPKSAPLPLGQSVITPACLTERAGGNGPRIMYDPIRVVRGTVVPHGNLLSLAGGSGTLNVGGTDVQLTFDPSSNAFGVKSGGKSVQLKEAGAGYDALPVPLPEKKGVLPVAFPLAVKSKDRPELYYRSAAVWTATCEKVALQAFDDNCDGQLTQADAVNTGGPVFIAVPKTLATKSGVFSVDAFGTDGISLGKVEGDTGSLAIEWTPGAKGGGQGFFAVSGGDCAGTAAAGGSLSVAPASYKLAYGVIAGPDKAFAAVVPADSSAVDVAKDAKAKLSLGAPFALRFSATVAGDKIKITPMVALFGKAKEQYVGYKYQQLPQVAVNGKVIGSMEYG